MNRILKQSVKTLLGILLATSLIGISQADSGSGFLNTISKCATNMGNSAPNCSPLTWTVAISGQQPDQDTMSFVGGNLMPRVGGIGDQGTMLTLDNLDVIDLTSSDGNQQITIDPAEYLTATSSINAQGTWTDENYLNIDVDSIIDDSGSLIAQATQNAYSAPRTDQSNWWISFGIGQDATKPIVKDFYFGKEYLPGNSQLQPEVHFVNDMTGLASSPSNNVFYAPISLLNNYITTTSAF